MRIVKEWSGWEAGTPGKPDVPAMTRRRDQRAVTYIVISKPKRKSVAVGVCQSMKNLL
jgi:hypothetical protein